jgi:hypothetical protein
MDVQPFCKTAAYRGQYTLKKCLEISMSQVGFEHMTQCLSEEAFQAVDCAACVNSIIFISTKEHKSNTYIYVLLQNNKVQSPGKGGLPDTHVIIGIIENEISIYCVVNSAAMRVAFSVSQTFRTTRWFSGEVVGL